MNPSLSQAKVVSLCLGAAVGYGIVHDQITARLCIEYFTVAHAPLIQTTSPTLIGLFWGVAATFGVGLALGCPLALWRIHRACHQSRWPSWENRSGSSLP